MPIGFGGLQTQPTHIFSNQLFGSSSKETYNLRGLQTQPTHIFSNQLFASSWKETYNLSEVK